MDCNTRALFTLILIIRAAAIPLFSVPILTPEQRVSADMSTDLIPELLYLNLLVLKKGLPKKL